MDLQKMSSSDKVALCRRYFYIGFALLPLVWIVNAIWFFESAFLDKPSPTQKAIRRYVLYSIIGASAWVLALIGWEIFFQLERAKGLDWTDRISFIAGVPNEGISVRRMIRFVGRNIFNPFLNFQRKWRLTC
ncbi:Gamma-secretase subunit pen-2 [Dirofilaria immitis]|nr:Gamma-secretase subunit pen-2 [Dirofilaria immitis]